MADEVTEERLSDFGTERTPVPTYLATERMVGGGTSNVYKVDVGGTSYAVKASPFSLEKEEKILSKVKHPHILPVLASGKAKLDVSHVPDDNNNGLTANTLRFKFVPNSLSSLLEDLSLAERKAILLQQSEVLEFVHRNGIVHKDIKPDNVLVEEGSSYLADFGNAEEFNLPEQQEEFERKKKKDRDDYKQMVAEVIGIDTPTNEQSP